MGDLKIDPFKQLLNEISHKLREENLQSLIHISGVPGAIESSMKDGLTLFKYLLEVDIISKENVGNLRNLLRQMRPKRRDIVHLVDEYIKKEFHTDDVSSVVGELGDSWGQIPNPLIPFNVALSETGTGIPSASRRALLNLDCNYMYCGCRGFPSCYVPLIIFFTLAIIFTAVCWYANVPRVTKHINANKDLKKAGVYIVILESLILVVLVARYVWLKYSHRKNPYSFSVANCEEFVRKPLQHFSFEEAPLQHFSFEEGSLQRFLTTSPLVPSADTESISRKFKYSTGSESAMDSRPGSLIILSMNSPNLNSL